MIFRRLALLLVVVALVGCNNEKNRNLIDRRMDQTTKIGVEALTPAPKVTFDPLTVSDQMWSGNKSVRLTRGIPLPAKFETSRGVTVISGTPLSLQDIVSAVTSQTGIPISVGGGVSVEDFDDDAESNSSKIPLAYEGSLSGLMNVLTSHFGLSWKYNGSALKMFKYETRVFVIEALPGEQTIKDGMKKDSSSGGGSSSSAAAGASFSAGSTNTLEQSSEMDIELKVWDELSQIMNSIIAGKGTVVLSPSTGTATVTTTPDKMEVISKYIEEENARLSQQIAVNVEIYSVSMSDKDDYELTFNTALKSISKTVKANYSQSAAATAADPIAGMGNLSLAIFDVGANGGEANLLFTALSKVGDTTRVAQFPMVTLNNRTVSRRVGTDQTYIASLSSSDSSATETSSNTVTPGTVREGFSLQLTPRVLQDGRIMMQYSFSLIDIIALTDFDTGAGGTVQLPETSSRVFVQQAMLKSGSTLIIGGHDDEKVIQSSQGTGSPYNYFLGGKSVNQKNRVMMFIAITPQIIDVRKHAERK